MATRNIPPPLTIDTAAATAQLKNNSIPPPPQTAPMTGNGVGSPGSPGYFHPKKQYQYYQHPYHHFQRSDNQSPPTPAAMSESSYWASPTSVSTTLTKTFTPMPMSSNTSQELLNSQSIENGGLEAFHTAVKVDSLYQQPQTPTMISPHVTRQQQHIFPKQQTYLQKFNSYTTDSRFSRLSNLMNTQATTATTTMAALSAIENDRYQHEATKLDGYQFPPVPNSIGHGQYVSLEGDHHMDHIESPGSPMSMTCPPPYQGGMYALERSNSIEKPPLTPTTGMARPKLARLSSTLSSQAQVSLPPMAIPISTEPMQDESPHAPGIQGPPYSAGDSAQAAQEKRTHRLIGADDESLYNLCVSEDEDENPTVKAMPSSTGSVQMSPTLPRYSRDHTTSLPSQIDVRPSETMVRPVASTTAAVTPTSLGLTNTQEPMQPVKFPSFWQDAKQHNMHWTFFSMGSILLASGAWIATMQIFAPWVIVLPIVTLSVLGLQYGHYRWKRSKFQKRQREECERRQRASTILFSDRPRRSSPWLHDIESSSPSLRGGGGGTLPGSGGATSLVQGGGGGGGNGSDDQPSPAYVPRISTTLEYNNNNTPAPPEVPQQSQQQQQHQWSPMTCQAPMRQNQQFLTVDTLSPLGMQHHLQAPQTPPPAYCLKRVELPEMDLGEDLTLSFDVNRFSM
ncbi:hypothetical protein BGW42_007626 [Actinomortierella wolfii]|nr:hypothetical protein BGW42_007626 [Actinomortierella wolfii]